MGGGEGERKLAAILSADVVGYSRLMEDDERATVRTLTDYRDVFGDHIARHRGWWMRRAIIFWRNSP